MQPWKLLADPSAYIFTWLNGYSGGLGSIAGVLIADYWLVRDKKLALGDLLQDEGRLRLHSGVELARGCGDADRLWTGVDHLVVPQLKQLYDYGWFVGFGASAVIHYFDEGDSAPGSGKSGSRSNAERSISYVWHCQMRVDSSEERRAA